MDEVTDATFADEVLASAVPVIVDFWAPWCKPCDAIEPHLLALAARWADRVRLVRLNVDENVAMPSRYDVLSLPTVILFSGGESVVSVRGARSKRHFERVFSPFLE